MADKARPTCLRAAPVLQVADVVRSEAFYRDTLGFVSHGTWGDPPAFCIVQRGGIADLVERPAEPFVESFVKAQRTLLDSLEGRA